MITKKDNIKQCFKNNHISQLTSKLQNIRLIAADLDGTLFTNSLELPKDFLEVITALNQKGIFFATASGRNWQTQKNFFQTQSNKISFICDNGAFIVQKQQPVFISILPNSLWMNIAQKCISYGDNCSVVLCGVNGTYSIGYGKNRQLQNVVEHFYTGLSIISNINLIHDQIFKVSICNLNGTGGSFFRDFSTVYGDKTNILRTAEFFMDIMNKDISKGSGLHFLQKQLNITPDETVVFGDFENDISLFEQATHTFIMKNAPLSMRKYAKYLAPSNDEEGVTKIIKQYIL